jgi:predicted RNA-binding Zn-ribbon protein involved in translation (DUF1610 family)
MKSEGHASIMIGGIILFALGVAITTIGMFMLAEYHPTVHFFRWDENEQQSEECLRAYTYESIGIVMTVTGFIVFVSSGIALLFLEDYIKYTCPRCQTTKRTFVWFLPKNCTSCGLPIEDFKQRQKRT